MLRSIVMSYSVLIFVLSLHDRVNVKRTMRIRRLVKSIQILHLGTLRR